jgi:hypothetical protein
MGSQCRETTKLVSQHQRTESDDKSERKRKSIIDKITMFLVFNEMEQGEDAACVRLPDDAACVRLPDDAACVRLPVYL